MTAVPGLCECDGSGEIRYESHREDMNVPLGDGETYIAASHSYMTRLCECRRALPPRPGTARWWDSETVWYRDLDLPTLVREVIVRVTCEVPVSDDGYRLIREGDNVYYPAMVQINESPTMITDDARALALAILAACEVADQLDERASA